MTHNVNYNILTLKGFAERSFLTATLACGFLLLVPTHAASQETGAERRAPVALEAYQAKPQYPESARQNGVQGTSVLKALVLVDGSIGKVRVEESAGHPDLDRAATEAVKKWRFEPARRGSESIAVWVLLPVRFELR